MKILSFLILLIGFSLNAGAASTCPQFIFFGDPPNRCDGTVEVSIVVCPASVTGPYTVDYVVWNMDVSGGTFTDTTTSLAYTHTYPTSGNYMIQATIHCTVGGLPCTTIAYHASSGSTIASLCSSIDGSTATTLNVSVIVFDMSLYISSPAQPAPIYSGTPVTVSGIYTGGLINTSSYAAYLDGATSSFLSGGGTLPTTVLNTYYFSPGQHTVEMTVADKSAGCTYNANLVIEVQDSGDYAPCATCFTFRPQAGERYWFSAWVKSAGTTAVTTYAGLGMYAQISYTGNSAVFNLQPTGDIIEGWQRIAGEFTVPAFPAPAATEIKVNLVNDNASTDVYFDDVRVHPFNASMKSYVNDAATFWLVAELDENNYATVYEYDKEGKLIRVKKETERGLFTIEEGRNSHPKN